MGVLRGLGRLAGLVFWLIALVPLLAIWPATVLDRGPRGDVRSTGFPFALTTLDPFLWDCARNSLVMAAGVAAGSLVLGVGLARVFVGRRFWGRRPLTAMAIAPLVIPPMIGALGLKMLLGSRLDAGGSGAWLGWACWAWAELMGGVPLVALATASALARVEPGWADAARLAGVGRLRTWRRLVWPVIRPDAAKAVAAVFTLTLAEPGAPLVLGMRRTLPFQVVEAALAPEPFPRAALLGLVAFGLATVGRVLIRWWGGPPNGILGEAPEAWPDTVPAPRASALVLALVLAAVVLWLPAAAVIASALPASPLARGASALPLARWFDGAEMGRLIANSFVLGAVVVAIDLLIARSLASGSGRRQRVSRALGQGTEAFPSLAIGVGALAIPWLLVATADHFESTGRPPALARALRAVASAIAPDMAPGLLLIVAVAATGQSSLIRIAAGGLDDRARHRLFEAAIGLGATTAQARRRSTSDWFGASPSVLFLLLVLAATNLSPSLLLAPTISSRPAAPGLLILAGEPADGLSKAARLATGIIAANVLALAIAARGRPRAIGDWFRGGT